MVANNNHNSSSIGGGSLRCAVAALKGTEQFNDLFCDSVPFTYRALAIHVSEGAFGQYVAALKKNYLDVARGSSSFSTTNVQQQQQQHHQQHQQQMRQQQQLQQMQQQLQQQLPTPTQQQQQQQRSAPTSVGNPAPRGVGSGTASGASIGPVGPPYTYQQARALTAAASAEGPGGGLGGSAAKHAPPAINKLVCYFFVLIHVR